MGISEGCDVSDDIKTLRAAIHTAHDHLHGGRVSEAHEALHCGINEREVAPANITSDDAARVQAFIQRFNQFCADEGVPAAVIVLLPSKTVAGAVSIQIGGHVPTMQAVRHLMGKGPTQAAGRA